METGFSLIKSHMYNKTWIVQFCFTDFEIFLFLLGIIDMYLHMLTYVSKVLNWVFQTLSDRWCFHIFSDNLCLAEGICYPISYGITCNSIKSPIDGRRVHDLTDTRCFNEYSFLLHIGL